MRKTSAAVLMLCFLLLLPAMCSAANNDSSPTAKNSVPSSAQNAQDRGAGYLPYSDPSPFGSGGFFGAIIRAIFSLVIVLALLYAVLWVIKKVTASSVGPSSSAGSLRVVGRIYLNPKVVIHFVRIVDELLVIGTNAGSISLLTTFKDERQIAQIENALRSAQPHVPGMAFSRFFDKSLTRFQKALDRDNSTFDDQLRVLNEQIGRLKGLTRKKHKNEN